MFCTHPFQFTFQNLVYLEGSSSSFPFAVCRVGWSGGKCYSHSHLSFSFRTLQTLLANIKAPDAESKSTIMAINLILQFLYFELRHSNRVRKWFHRKLSLELDELISKTTTGKLFDKLSVSKEAPYWKWHQIFSCSSGRPANASCFVENESKFFFRYRFETWTWEVSSPRLRTFGCTMWSFTRTKATSKAWMCCWICTTWAISGCQSMLIWCWERRGHYRWKVCCDKRWANRGRIII